MPGTLPCRRSLSGPIFFSPSRPHLSAFAGGPQSLPSLRAILGSAWYSSHPKYPLPCLNLRPPSQVPSLSIPIFSRACSAPSTPPPLLLTLLLLSSSFAQCQPLYYNGNKIYAYLWGHRLRRSVSSVVRPIKDSTADTTAIALALFTCQGPRSTSNTNRNWRLAVSCGPLT